MSRKTVFKCIHGSHLYGLNTESSDQDFKGIVIPSKEELKNNTAPKTSYEEKTNNKGKNTSSDVDTTLFTLKSFLRLCEEGQTVASEMLFCPPSLYVQSSPLWEEILSHREKLLHRGVSAFYGYARKQAYKYSVKGVRIEANKLVMEWAEKIPNQERLVNHLLSLEVFVKNSSHLKSSDNSSLINFTTCIGPKGEEVPHLEVCQRRYPLTITGKYFKQQLSKVLDDYGKRALMAYENKGADFKALSHALRVGYQAVELLSTHKLTFPRPEQEYLLAVKLGKVPYQEIETEIELFLSKIEEAGKVSTLPEKMDTKFWEKFLKKQYDETLLQPWLFKLKYWGK